MVRIIEPEVEIFELNNTNDITTHIEKCGRTCYKSENLITTGSAEKFINGILKSGHESVIEHANLIFEVEPKNSDWFSKEDILIHLQKVKGLNLSVIDNKWIISGNIRTFRDLTRDNFVNDFNEYFKNDELLKVFYIDIDESYPVFKTIKLVGVQEFFQDEKHHYITIRAKVDVGCYKDLTRHRLSSFSIESTRYCSYNKDKFGNEIGVIKPVNIAEGTSEYNIWLDAMNYMEQKYMEMSKVEGIKTDQLRMLLPHSTKADMIMSCNISEWKHIFNLRCAKQAHPSVRQIMLKTLDLFYKTYPTIFEKEYNLFKDDILDFSDK